jgi:predicted dinucleotide-binding enzyme
MRIGIVGKGNVASTLGPLWSKCGHEVIFGVRDPENPAVAGLLDRCCGRARAIHVSEVFRQADIILLAVRAEDIPAVLGEAGDLRGTTLIDCTTPLERGTWKPMLDWRMSGAEELARAATGADVVKCFDTTGVKVMECPAFDGQKTTMFLCGDSVDAKERVRGLAEELGFECVDVGPLSAARYLEALSAFWVYLAFNRKFGADFGFKLLRR